MFKSNWIESFTLNGGGAARTKHGESSILYKPPMYRVYYDFLNVNEQNVIAGTECVCVCNGAITNMELNRNDGRTAMGIWHNRTHIQSLLLT